MYTMSVIGLLLYPVGFVALAYTADQSQGVAMGVFQLFGLLFVYAFALSLVGLVHSIRCRKKNKK